MTNMACIIIAVIAIPLICLMAGLLMYNGLVQKRNMVDNAFSSVDVNLKKRADLVPNLVATVKGYASHERQLFESVTRLRLEIHSSTSDDQRFDLEKQLGSQMNRLFALAESYPELKSSEGFLNLQRNLTELEEQISAARRAMNAAVLQLNNAVDTFPSAIIASMFGFQRRAFFKATTNERAIPHVQI